MVKLLIIADDFTGALDTGVQFAIQGIGAKVLTDIGYDFSGMDEDAEVLVINTETRHTSPKEAYRIVRDLSERALGAGVAHIYKKTDSAMRGNVGSELRAVLDASKQSELPFVPAFPEMNRTTDEGNLYIDGIPVNESVFGSDPFSPVASAHIPVIIQENTDVKVSIFNKLKNLIRPNKHICVYDAATDDDLQEIADKLKDENRLTISAGCAGFAKVLPETLGLATKEIQKVEGAGRFLIACGSVNPITKRQIEHAVQNGIKRVNLTPPQKLDGNYFSTEEGEAFLEELKTLYAEEKVLIIDTNDVGDLDATKSYAGEKGYDINGIREQISKNLGHAVKLLLDAAEDSIVLITGGDSLLGYMKQIGCEEIIPLYELAPGTVLSYYINEGKKRHIISKSGGFGREDLLVSLASNLLTKENEVEGNG
ncbi:four-carbon acid sugar kinase family protein [Anaerotalea alkaliphila]|uniref:Four-carbon acid sugar kinase family protein n=1 Tax=Anaerotalea alkaliphila TaxID=2662126 RepID=A0A7X5KLB6_9FIRM|nr:four-carbon acid sugar kinase family protein [Anaerotalea alkaliphila]NDL66661.1 four-carbon acid sugar kinase family protein [Anaerotalea alkaliphila]